MAEVGQTADGSWEVGVRRTVPLEQAAAWTAALEIVEGDPAAGAPTSLTAEEVARFPYGAGEGRSTLQIRVLPAATGTTIAFHHEGLGDGEDRETMRLRWSVALDEVAG